MAIVGTADPIVEGQAAPIALALQQGLGSTSEEHGIRRPDGRVSRILLSVIPILGEDGRPVGAIAYAEPMDRAAAATLAEAFLGVLSHELRTPITSIYGGSQLLLRNELSPGLAQVLEGIAAEAEQLQRRVEDFLAVARVERGLNVPLREPIPIKRSIEAAVAGEHRRSPDQRYMVRVDPELPPAVGDDGQVRQVLRNLLSIATRVDATRPGDPGSRIRSRRVGRGPGQRPRAGPPIRTPSTTPTATCSACPTAIRRSVATCHGPDWGCTSRVRSSKPTADDSGFGRDVAAGPRRASRLPAYGDAA